MPRYQQYNSEALRNGTLVVDIPFAIFRLIDCDDEVMADEEVVRWAEVNSDGIHVDPDLWRHPATQTAEPRADYPRAMVVDSLDTAILLIGDPDLALAFKTKFC